MQINSAAEVDNGVFSSDVSFRVRVRARDLLLDLGHDHEIEVIEKWSGRPDVGVISHPIGLCVQTSVTVLLSQCFEESLLVELPCEQDRLPVVFVVEADEGDVVDEKGDGPLFNAQEVRQDSALAADLCNVGLIASLAQLMEEFVRGPTSVDCRLYDKLLR